MNNRNSFNRDQQILLIKEMDKFPSTYAQFSSCFLNCYVPAIKVSSRVPFN